VTQRVVVERGERERAVAVRAIVEATAAEIRNLDAGLERTRLIADHSTDKLDVRHTTLRRSQQQCEKRDDGHAARNETTAGSLADDENRE